MKKLLIKKSITIVLCRRQGLIIHLDYDFHNLSYFTLKNIITLISILLGTPSSWHCCETNRPLENKILPSGSILFARGPSWFHNSVEDAKVLRFLVPVIVAVPLWFDWFPVVSWAHSSRFYFQLGSCVSASSNPSACRCRFHICFGGSASNGLRSTTTKKEGAPMLRYWL